MTPRRPGPAPAGSTGIPALLTLLLTLVAAPVQAASSLVAWRISSGDLELRTAPGVMLQAYYQEGAAGQGPRIWVDLPGRPSRPRSLAAGGALRAVRIGQPEGDATRLVLEFMPGTSLDPRQLRLVGTARDRWRMALPPEATSGLPSLGEGDLDAIAAIGGDGRGRSPGAEEGRDGRPGGPSSAGAMLPRGRFTVVIDPGHGGPDPGAVGINGLRETDIVLDVSLQVAQQLQSRGIQVLLTRTTEVDVDLPPRVALANDSGADLFVSLHANALSLNRPDVNGVETFYFEGGASRELASAIQQRLMAASPGTPDRGARPGRFYVIRRTTMPSALVELGFVTGVIDAPRLADPGFRRRLAEAVSDGILEVLSR